jgi:transketolase C-terminal domain/subunit
MSAALASVGFIPFVTTFAVFLLRAIEQVRLSIAYGKVNVKLIASHPGLDVGPDGASAQCLEDLACFRAIPNMVVLSPCDEIEMEKMLKAIIKYNGPIYLRTGRSPAPIILNKKIKFQIGKAQILRFNKNSKITIISCGIMTSRAIKAFEILKKQRIKINVINMSSIKPIDEKTIIKSVSKTKRAIITDTSNNFCGISSTISNIIYDKVNNLKNKLKIISLPFCPEPTSLKLVEKFYNDRETIVNYTLKMFNIKKKFKLKKKIKSDVPGDWFKGPF